MEPTSEKQPEDPIAEDRRIGYLIILEKMITDPALILAFAERDGCTFERAYVLLDKRIRELRARK